MDQLLRTLIGLVLVFTGITGTIPSIEPVAAATSAEPALLELVAIAADQPADATPTAPAPLEFVDMPTEQVAMADWAISLFDQAGLRLPPLRFVHHHGDLDPCRGRAGLHRRVDGVNVIEICTIDSSFSTRVMILHETAHAWVDHALTDERKAQFQELRGWEHWRAHSEVAWHENGTEQAAEIMVWGMIDQPLRMVRIDQASCAELEAGFATLTGQAPLHGFHDHC